MLMLPRPWDNPHGSVFWRSIAAIAPIFTTSVSHQIGNGNRTQFWEDNWIGQPLKLLFPNLYSMIQHKYGSVNHYASNPDWLMRLTASTHAAQVEKQELILRLQQLHIVQEEDKLIWLRGGPSYTVGSIYTFLSHPPSPTSQLRSIWKIKAPLRILVFAWLALLNRLTTVDNLKRRGWCIPNMCTMCRKDEETVAHLFQFCSLAKEIRNYIHSTFAVQLDLPLKFVAENSLSILTDTNENAVAKQWELTTCFIIWRERCRRVFSDRVTDHIQLVREIRMEYTAWFS